MTSTPAPAPTAQTIPRGDSTRTAPAVFLYRHGLAGGGAGKAVLDQARVLSDGGHRAVILCSSPKVTLEQVVGLRESGVIGDDVAVLHPTFLDERSRVLATEMLLPTGTHPAGSDRDLVRWLDLLLAAAPEGSFFVANAPFATTKLARTTIAGRFKLAVLHGNHLAAPFTAGAHVLPAYQEILDEARSLDGLIVLTERHAADIRSIVNGDVPVYVVPNSTAVVPVPATEREPHLVSMVSRLAADKSVHEAIQAFATVIPRVPDAKLEIWGAGPLKPQLSALIDELGLGKSVTLSGYTRNVHEAIARSACSILTSFAEGQGLVILEAAMSARPFVAYDCLYGPSTLIEDGVTGHLVRVGARGALADAIVSLLLDPVKADEMGRVARERVIARYAPDVVLADWERTFTAVAAAASRVAQSPGEARLPTDRARAAVRVAVRSTRRLTGRGVRVTSRVLKALPKRARKTLTAWRSAARNAGRMAWYAACRLLPIDDNLAVYSAYWGRSVTCNPAAIAASARELVPQVRQIWAVRRTAVASVPEGVDYVIEGSRAYWTAVARAKYLVNNVNFPNQVVKRRGQVHVWTQHGTPLKHMGLDLQGAPAGKGTDFHALVRRCARWDYCISSNTFSSAIWPQAFPGPYEVLDVGYPRNDVLSRATGDDVLRVRVALGLEPGTRAFLYMPTHRDAGRRPELELDLPKIAEVIGDDGVILARGHYLQGAGARIKEAERTGRVVDVTAYPRVEDLYLAADALITDYSSAMFDYAVLDRPIVIYAPDWDEYVAGRGVYFDLVAEPPGVVTSTPSELANALHTRVYASKESATLRHEFRENFCNFDDGLAAERVVRRVFLEDTTPIPVAPLGSRSHAPEPCDLEPGAHDHTADGGTP